MTKTEKEPQNPYKLSTEELTCPGKGMMVTAWFDQLVARQREGIKNGVRPQNPIGLNPERRKKWINKVWNLYLSEDSFSKEEQRIIRGTKEPGDEKHGGSSRHYRHYRKL